MFLQTNLLSQFLLIQFSHFFFSFYYSEAMKIIVEVRVIYHYFLFSINVFFNIFLLHFISSFRSYKKYRRGGGFSNFRLTFQYFSIQVDFNNFVLSHHFETIKEMVKRGGDLQRYHERQLPFYSEICQRVKLFLPRKKINFTLGILKRSDFSNAETSIVFFYRGNP